jgi:hypothetical protein
MATQVKPARRSAVKASALPAQDVITKTCEHCESKFVAKKAWNKYCSTACAYSARKGKERYRPSSEKAAEKRKVVERRQKQRAWIEEVFNAKMDVSRALSRCGLQGFKAA